MNIINLYDNYNSYFNSDLKAPFKFIFEQCSKIASEHDFKLYLIGGIVRDMLLNIENLDIDITVEGDAIEFAHFLEKECNAKIISEHKDFGTVKVKFDGESIDFASTRSESYPKKGHLPHVDKIGCSLNEDVIRRDFTINSLALSLNQENFAHLIDYVNGFEDLKAKRIKILHDKSFIDDPTRIIRALKYSTRLGFEIEEKTLELQNEYLNTVNYDMSYKRVKQEIKKTFEQNSQIALDKFIEQKIYKLITEDSIKKAPENVEKVINIYPPKQPWIVYFGIIAIQLNEDILEKLKLTKEEKDIIEGAKSLLNQSFKNDFEIYKAFCAQKLETLLILALFGKEKEVFNYLDNLQKIKLNITGKDLIELGYNPSKHFNEIFDFVLKEKLKNPKITKAEEIKLAQKFL